MIEQPKEQKVAAIYVRVSTQKQDSENQLIQLRPYCERKGYLVYNEYIDVVSGRKDSRPGWNRLFKDAHQHRFDVVVFWALDRFSRSGTTYTLMKLRELENLGVDWDSFTEPHFGSAGPFKEVVLAIMSTLAKIESDRISERTKAGLARARAAGRLPGRKKGTKDKKKRRTKGYYDNVNYVGNKKRGVEKPHPKPPQNYVHPHLRKGGQSDK
jgi:DNA invertase Pin-like site-specific DNA recombinase